MFNLLGPLTNPAGVRLHVNGIFSRERAELLAQAHAALGSRRAMVVHGTGGLDEFAPAGSTFVAQLRGRQGAGYELTPSAFGLDESDPAGLAGGLPEENARIALALLDGGGPPAARNAALMTAGAAIYVAGAAPDLKAATARARAVLSDGGARGRARDAADDRAARDKIGVMILDDILTRTRVDLAPRKQAHPLAEVAAAAA